VQVFLGKQEADGGADGEEYMKELKLAVKAETTVCACSVATTLSRESFVTILQELASDGATSGPAV
jgi:ribonuclease HIII